MSICLITLDIIGKWNIELSRRDSMLLKYQNFNEWRLCGDKLFANLYVISILCLIRYLIPTIDRAIRRNKCTKKYVGVVTNQEKENISGALRKACIKCNATISYTIEGKLYNTKSLSLSYKEYNVGDEIEIRYNPKDFGQIVDEQGIKYNYRKKYFYDSKLMWAFFGSLIYLILFLKFSLELF